MIVVVLAATWGIRTYILEPFQIPSASMEQTIQTGDRVFAEKVTYLAGEPQPGDIVVFSDPQIPSRILIKRVIATEGQVIDFQDGKVLIDGVEQPSLLNATSYTFEDLAANHTIEVILEAISQGQDPANNNDQTDSKDKSNQDKANTSSSTSKTADNVPCCHFL